MQLKQWTVLLALGLSNTLACSSDGNGGGGAPMDPDATGGTPGERPPNMTETAVAWDDASALGVAPAEAFAEFEGSCKAPFEWTSEDDMFTRLEPASGQSEVTVTVAFDESSARVVECGGSGIGCGKYLTARAHVSIATADGVFADEGDAPAHHAVGSDNYISLLVPQAEMGGALKITTKGEATDASLTYNVLSVGSACQGKVDFGLFVPHEDGRGGIGFDGVLGSWSSNACEPGSTPSDLTTPFPPAASLKDAISDAWRAKVYAGEWDDGTAAQLTLTVSDVPDEACHEATPFNPATLVPVRLTYSTDDGRIPVSTISANLRVTDHGPVRKSLQLIADHEATCASPESSLPYTPARCDEGVGRVLLQILVNDELGASAGPSAAGNAGVTVYQYAASAAVPGAADVVHTFSTSPRDGQ